MASILALNGCPESVDHYKYSARRDYLQAQYDFVTNQLVLLRWSGGFRDTDIQKINGWLAVPTPGEERKTGVKEGEVAKG